MTSEVLQQRIVDAPTDAVASHLTRPEVWLEGAAERAGRGGQAVEVKLRAAVGRPSLNARLGKRVRFEAGKLQHIDAKLVVPLTWQASGFPGLFPVMDAVVELHRVGRDRTRVVFWGRYDPPLGRAGDLIDRFIAHQVAEATVRQLLELIEQHVSMTAPSDVEAPAEAR